MTKTEQVPTTMSVSDKIATYFVVPIVPETGTSENVWYYEEVSETEKWKKVSSKNLNARGQNRDAGKIMLLQPSTDTIRERTGLPLDKLDQTVALYAGVARTLTVSQDPLESVYPLAADGTLTIPVIAHTVRGLILVFSKWAGPGMPPYPITQLIASTDPEIKNTTGGI